MQKRGAVTVFIILALLIVFSFSAYFIARSNVGADKKADFDTAYADSLRNYIDSCLKDTTSDGLVYAGMNGGYVYFPLDLQRININSNLKLSVLYNQGKKSLLPLPEIERQLALYVEEKLQFCIDFSSFEEQRYAVEDGEVEANITIGDESVLAKIVYPVNISKGEKIVKMDEFTITVPLRFGKIYKTVNQTLSDLAYSDSKPAWELEEKVWPYLAGEPGYSLNFILNSYDMNVSYDFFDEQVSIWSVSDDFDGDIYRFSFAAVHPLKREV